jgi:hypothetical protein
MTRRFLTALSATTFFLVSCGGTNYAETWVGISNDATCALAEAERFFSRDDVNDVESEEDFAPLLEEFQTVTASASSTMKQTMSDVAAVEWPDEVADDIDDFFQEVSTVASLYGSLSSADSAEEIFGIMMRSDMPPFTAANIIKAKLGVDDDLLVSENQDLFDDLCN